MGLHGSYHPVLVVLSVGVAILASFTALNLAGRLLVADRAARRWWLLAAALALGGGIWSMHFVGMLAFIMPMPATYDVWLTLASLILPVLVTGAGLHTVSRFGNGWRPLAAAGLLAGLGVVVMHYSGMAAMRMPGVTIGYDRLLVVASIVIAVVAATAAFWLAFRTSALWERVAAAVVMGFAIAGMHYTAMAAARFTLSDHQAAVTAPGIEPGILAVAVVSATSILLLLGLLTAFFDRKLATLTAREAAALTQSEERHRALIRNASDIVAILDPEGLFVYEGSSARNVLGYGTDDLLGRLLTDFVPAEQIGGVQRFLASLLDQPGTQLQFELGMRHRDGTWRSFEVIGKNLVDEPAIAGIVINLRDITERKLLVAALEKLSETDPLTGAFNRRGFLRLAELEFERGRRSAWPLSTIMIDIDHFKQVNDAYGHAAGDLVLAAVAEGCRAHVRDSDLLARFGGEEFLVLMADCTVETAHEIVERLRLAVAAARVPTIRGEISVTASFGIATVDPRITDLETAIRLADEALYEAKNAGRNCIKVRATAGE